MGTGDQIKIWEHKWILIPYTYTIQSPISVLRKEATIQEIIDTEKEEWNWGLISQIFNPKEVEIICSLPLCRGRVEDKLIW